MRVAVVCPYDLDTDGGVQQLCRELVSRLTQGGDEARLIGPGSGPEAVGPSLNVRANRSSAPVCLHPRAARVVRDRLEWAQVVHVHEPFVPLVGWAALRASAPRVATFHADPAAWTRLAYRAGATVGSRLLAGAVITAASPVAAEAIPPEWGEPQVIPNAIDVDSYAPDVPRLPHRAVFLGRDEPRKGLDVLLRAWPEVRRQVPSAELVVMGRGRRADIPGVDFRGRVDEAEKRRTLASAAVMVAPNLGGESFGITLAEAMAAGCAVVASDLEAFVAVLAGDGIVVPVADSARLAEEVAALLSHPSRAAALGDRARAAAGRFDWPSILARYRAAYESAVARHRTTIPPWKE